MCTAPYYYSAGLQALLAEGITDFEIIWKAKLLFAHSTQSWAGKCYVFVRRSANVNLTQLDQHDLSTHCLSQLEFGNHDWSWLINKNHHVKWNIFHDFWWSAGMAYRFTIRSPKITKNVSFNMMTFHDIWWFLVPFDDYWCFFIIKSGDL